MKRLLRLSPLALVLALVSSSQLSCSVNDYCLNCEKGDGGGSGSNNDGGMDGNGDGGPDAGCVPNPPEICNNKDDDCNGLVDDNTTDEGGVCDNVQGACAGGVKVCTNGVIKCNKEPTPEICDGIDNNCSGPIGTSNGIDEGDPGPAPAVGTAELTAQCGNGLDDDSDGTIDDGCPGTGGKCGTDQGECIAGQFHCNPVTGHIECQNFVDHRGFPELCNAKDDDCDGNFDENIPPGADCGPSTNVGACEFGKILCVGGNPTCGDPDPTDAIPMPVFPKFEICNNLDDDCNGVPDEIFNKDTDIKNCGDCGVICPTRMNANTTCTPQGNPLKGTCGFTCKPGFKDLNGMAVDGCEFGPCFPTGNEECDGDDNDCDNKTDEGLIPPQICLKGGECGGSYTDPNGSNPLGPAPTAVCGLIPGGGGATGWSCTYPGDVQAVETKCDTKDNDCDGQADEFQISQGLGNVCHEDREDPATQCNDMLDNDGDGRVNDGCPAMGQPETACNDVVDDDNDGKYNDGCPAVARVGICQGTGTLQCDTQYNINGAPYCNITSPGQPALAFEKCDDTDNDCDGKTDEGAATGSLNGQDWVDLGNGRQMMKYEASRPDSSGSNQGSKNTTVCSKANVLPWTNVKYQDALAACQSVGAQLCTESQWHHACSVVGTSAGYPTYPISVSGAALYIEAEDYSSIGVGAVTGSAENGAGCAAGNTQDNDADGVLNDGCPMVGTAPETQCNDTADNDNDGTANDGCPAYGPSAEATCNELPSAGGIDEDKDGVVNDGCPTFSGTAELNCRDGIDDDNDGRINDGCPAVGPAFVPDYTSGFSGITAMEAVPNFGVAVTTAANAPAQSARLDYVVNFTATSTTYHVWVKMYANSLNDDRIWLGVNNGVPPQTPTISMGPTPIACTSGGNCAAGTSCVDTNGDGNRNASDFCSPVQAWQWVDSGAINIASTGVQTISLYMQEDGVKIDRLYIVNGATNPATGETLTTKGGKWAYLSTPNTYQANTCNGHDYRTYTNSSLSRATTGLVSVTTTAAHSFVVGDLVQIQGASAASLPNTFDGIYTVLSVGTNTFTYQQNSNVAATATAFGTSTEARDPTLITGSLTSCVANTGTGAFDMSGNVREWTLAHSPGESAIRGGAANGTADGISCPLNFTLADDTFFFPNIGFRCCR